MERNDLANIRRDFSSKPLDESEVSSNPFEQFTVWMEVALDSAILDPNAMTVATVGPDGRPSTRVVLLKHYDSTGFTFFTNYDSKKGRDLSTNPETVLHFFWPALNRQIGIYGHAKKTSREVSEKYFNSRPVDSRLGAWASRQSSQVASREQLEDRFAELKSEYGQDVPLPPFWGGFRVVPYKFEFWQGRQNRLHDRLCYLLRGGDWAIERLSP